ncbi:hypothetical protein [Cyanobium gracile]|uniref:Uncharacterized protein n=1 Tax=Cyanobium gracile UHCC 0281 TaxID=3110309 RepID=A0ABU5SYN3_9CYAN|nr:hypothetical protein [Cyanobium gracile]MEA5443614.1 hypothetical protein [Cyanobium gracile UHCC 0281]
MSLSKRGKTADGVELAEITPVGSTMPVKLTLVQDGMALMDRQYLGPCSLASHREAEWIARTK